MNYERIYNEFIFDRREKEKKLTKINYTERHHIIPRCMNGTDEKDNLIKLTPEDHFFAHLLLAKAYGDKNWLALSSMLYRGMKTSSINYTVFRNKRKEFGFTRRLLAKNLTGLNNPASDKNIYTLKNFDGREVIGYRFEISNITGLLSKQIGQIAKGEKNSIHGWYSPEFNPEGKTGQQINKDRKLLQEESKQRFKLYHYDGREWEGTEYEFKQDFGKALKFYKEVSHCQGFFKKKALAKQHLKKRSNNEKPERRLFKFKIVNTKEIIYLSKKDFSKRYNKTIQEVTDLILGNRGRLAGIEYVGEKILKHNKKYKFEIIETGNVIYSTVVEAAKKFDISQERLHKLIKGQIKKGQTKGIKLAD